MKDWLNNLLSGARGTMIRAIAPTLIGFGVAQFKENQWYIAAGPLLALVSKWLHVKYPDNTFVNLLPF
jgi:hypothetical protein